MNELRAEHERKIQELSNESLKNTELSVKKAEEARK